MKLKLLSAVQSLTRPKQHQNEDTIAYWRENIFYSIIFGGIVIGFFALVPSIMSCFQDELYIQMILDFIVYGSLFIFLLNKRLPFKLKTNIFLGIIYLLGVSLILSKGPYASGFIYLVAFSVVASVWRGTMVSIYTILINVITLSSIAILHSYDVFVIDGFKGYNLTHWISLGMNVFVANTISAISVGLLLDSLDRTLKKSTKLKNQLGKEKIKLMAAKQKAEESDSLKTSFLANMSHELKTPLNCIIGFSNIILEDEITDQDLVKEYQSRIAESGEMLLELINDILDITVIEAGQLKIKKSETNLNDLVAEIAHTFDDSIIDKMGKPITFTIVDKVNTEPYGFETDRLRLKQIIINLIKNALKFTSAGTVEFSYEKTPDNKHLRFSVKDTGIGIPFEDQEEVFNRFRKLESSARNKIKGTGLGLAISKELVENLGGEIKLTSTPGVGLTFSFTIPIATEETIAIPDTKEVNELTKAV